MCAHEDEEVSSISCSQHVGLYHEDCCKTVFEFHFWSIELNYQILLLILNINFNLDHGYVEGRRW